MTKKHNVRKKVLSMILALTMIATMMLAVLPMEPVHAADSAGFDVVGNTVTAYSGNGGDITIPAGATSIAANVFANKTNITSVNLNGVNALGDGVFSGCSSLKTVTILGNFTSIPANTFKDCISLTSIVIPASVTSIGDRAFSGCRTLTTVGLPSSLTALSSTAFENCSALQTFTISGNSTYTTYDGCLYTLNSTTLSKVPAGKSSINFATGVNTIATGAFENCNYISSVTIPDSVYNIQADAFKNSGVVFMTIPRTTTTIGTQTNHKLVSISGYTNSAAQTFAANHNISFIALDTSNIVSVTGLTLDKSTLAVDVNATATLTPTIAPANATNKAVTWKSSDNKIATVSNTGVVKGIASGNVVITATSVDGSKTATCNVTVGSGGITSVSLDKEAITLRVGGTGTQLTASVLPATASTTALTWSSSDTNVATVSSTGLVTPVGAGTATITVSTSDKTKSATCKVTVSNEKATGITISAKDVSLNKGGSIILSAALTPSTSLEDITWSTDDSDVVSIVSQGNNATIKGLAEGETVVYAKCESGFTASCIVRVENENRALIDKIKNSKGKVKKSKMSGTTLSVTVKKISISGITVKYQIRYKQDGTTTWKAKKISSTSKKITGLKKGATYSVQVRPYAVIGGKTYYGNWSD